MTTDDTMHSEECAEAIRHTGRCAIGCPLSEQLVEIEGQVPARPQIMIDAGDWAFVQDVVRSLMPTFDDETRARLLAMKVQPFAVVGVD